MGHKIVYILDSTCGSYKAYVFFCPGCQEHHSFDVALDKIQTPRFWGFNGNLEKPTFTPSLNVNPHDPKRHCHSFVQNGNIQFLSDCWHDLKGQTVPLPPHQWD